MQLWGVDLRTEAGCISIQHGICSSLWRQCRQLGIFVEVTRPGNGFKTGGGDLWGNLDVHVGECLQYVSMLAGDESRRFSLKEK